MRIKICGITTIKDALTAVEVGADLLGFNFYPKSPRYLLPADCAAIVSSLQRSHPHIVTVGVFVNLPPVEIQAILDTCGLHIAQLSGDEPPETLEAFHGKAFKALRPTSMAAMTEGLFRYPPRSEAPAYLVDACRPGQYGGTGATTDWQVAHSLARQAPILLAGGLTPSNVATAIAQVHPWGVDVASGVEASPGRKDPTKMAAFVQAVKQAIPKPSILIEPAQVSDAAEILALQKLAYQSEAELNQDYTIPPLTQTLPEIEAEFPCLTFLKYQVNGAIVGSVRAFLQNGTCHIGRLIVHPDWQNQGIGRCLMQDIEHRFHNAKRYELFTSQRSTRNLYFYQKLGYRPFRTERANNRVTLVYLEKSPPP